MNTPDKLDAKAIEDIIVEAGYELVDFKTFIAQGRYIVRCLVDRSRGGITLLECSQLNKKIFSYLNQDDEAGQDFVVEVNSPGLDRKLTNIKDFQRIAGRQVGIWLKKSYDAQLEGQFSSREDLLTWLADEIGKSATR